MRTHNAPPPESIRYHRTRNAVLRHVAGEHLLVPIRSDGTLDAESLDILDAVGAAVWEALAQPATRAEIEAAVRSGFDVPEGHAVGADLQELLDDLLKQGLATEEKTS